MREKPILFNTDMVKAILEGRKTVTRRVVKPQPQRFFEVNENPFYLYDVEWNIGQICPKYQVGDIIWVRETWTPFCINKKTCSNSLLGHADYCYKASPEECVNSLRCKWQRSIHMPREAARIFLKVTDVRVERLQDITKDWNNFGKEGIREEHGFRSEMHRYFIKIWNSTIKKQDIDIYGWETNSWVWVIEFERVEVPE